MVTIALLSAFPAETEELSQSLVGSARLGDVPWPVWTGTLGGKSVVMALSGLGKVNAAALTAVLIERFAPKVMIFTGVAGGLDSALDVGDVVVGKRVVQHDWGVLGPDGLEHYQAGHVPFFNPTEDFGYQPPSQLIEAMREVAERIKLVPVTSQEPRITFGTILTGDQFLVDEAMGERLHHTLGGVAVEMEGAAFAQVATRYGIDHLVLRSISDRASGGAAEDFTRFVPKVAANSARMVQALVAKL